MFSNEEAHAMCELAHQLMDAGRLDDARLVVEGVLRHAPNSAWAWYAAGRLAFDAGDFQRAAEFLEQACGRQLTTEAAMLWVEALVVSGRHAEARQLGAKLGIRRDPECASRLDAMKV
ncbi:MAG: tetratricopeptide repeat protein [bacterium]